jgi:hypothetical protein
MLMRERHIGRSRSRAVFAGRVLLLVALGVAPAGLAQAGSDGRKGTEGALELKLPVGPRGIALGNAVASDATGVDALFYNPAGLATTQNTEVAFSHTNYIADMKINFAAVATNLKGLGVLAFNVKVLSVGDIIVTTEDAPEGTGQILNPSFTTLGGSWAKQFTDRVNFGATATLVNEHILDATATGVAFDFGVQYFTGWRGLRFGVAMKNFGTPMTYGGPAFDASVSPPGTDPTSSNRTFRSTSASFELPSYFNFGASANIANSANQRLTLLTSYQSSNFGADNLCGAAEWSYRNTFALRGSYFGSIRETPDPITGESTVRVVTGDDVYSGYALGAGALVHAGEMKLGIDIAWRPVREFFDDTVDAGLTLRF